jgi:MFS superfamily sulfate permease-like transporter
LAADVTTLVGSGDPPAWLCLDGAAIGDVDYTAAAVLTRLRGQLAAHGTRFVLSGVIEPVRGQLDRYGLTAAVGPGAYFDTAGEALDAFRAGGSTSDTKG